MLLRGKVQSGIFHTLHQLDLGDMTVRYGLAIFKLFNEELNC